MLEIFLAQKFLDILQIFSPKILIFQLAGTGINCICKSTWKFAGYWYKCCLVNMVEYIIIIN